MHFDSTHARHKLLITALLLTLFAIPFALQWQAVEVFNSQAVMAGATVVGGAESIETPKTLTNDVEPMAATAGSSFTGALTQ